MDIGKTIHDLRVKNGLTQKDLSEKLHVTSQAVSRWEQDLVEPSIGTLKELAIIFNVSVDEIINFDESQIVKQEPAEQLGSDEIRELLKEELRNQPKSIGMCEVCQKALLEGDEIYEHTKYSGRNAETYYLCKDCEEKLKQKQKEDLLEDNRKARNKGWWALGGTIVGGIILTVIFALINVKEYNVYIYPIGIFGSIFLGMFAYCIAAKNNFIGDMWWWIVEFGFVKMPGLIFELSLDGIVWLLTVKLFFWILEFLIAGTFFLLGTGVGMIASIVVFPFSVYRSYKKPEKFEY